MEKMRLAGEGKHYKIYTSYGLPSKSHLAKKGMAIAKEFDAHQTNILFIPGKFTVQYHGWGNTKLNNLSEMKKFVLSHINDVNLEKKMGGKWHWDLRIAKLVNGHLNVSWFGFTLFRQPWTGTVENKVLGNTKGYARLTDLGERLREKMGTAQMETGSAMKWMTNEGWIDVGEEGNPTKQWPSAMILVERLQPCVIHRRQIDFVDITFLGKYLVGRYYIRLVHRKISEEEKLKYQKGKEVKAYQLFLWKAKDQFDLDLMRDVASGKITVAPKLAPVSKDKRVPQTAELLGG